VEIGNSCISNLARRRVFVVGSVCRVWLLKKSSVVLLCLGVILLFGGQFGKSSNVGSKGAYVQILCWLLKEHNTVTKNI